MSRDTTLIFVTPADTTKSAHTFVGYIVRCVAIAGVIYGATGLVVFISNVARTGWPSFFTLRFPSGNATTTAYELAYMANVGADLLLVVGCCTLTAARLWGRTVVLVAAAMLVICQFSLAIVYCRVNAKVNGTGTHPIAMLLVYFASFVENSAFPAFILCALFHRNVRRLLKPSHRVRAFDVLPVASTASED